jgi:hypothetical protein
MAGILGGIVTQAPVINYAQGAAQKAAQPVADFLAPTVPVAAHTGTITVYDEKSRFRVPNTKRTVHQRATQIKITGRTINYQLVPHALDVPVDVIEQAGGLFYASGAPIPGGTVEGQTPSVINLFNEAADMGAQVGALSHEKEVIDLAIATLGAGTDVTWNDAADPINDVDGYVLQVLKAAKYGSLMGANLLFGATGWQVFKNQANVRGRFIVGSGAPTGVAVPTLDNASQLFLGNPKIRQSLMVYDDAPEGLAEDVQFILDNTLIVFASLSAPNRHDPSFMKTLRPAGAWMVPGTYLSEDQRQTVAKLDWFMSPYVGNTQAGVRLNILTGETVKKDLRDATESVKDRVKKNTKE